MGAYVATAGEALTGLLYRHFFSILLVLISVAQWVCVAWLLALSLDVAIPPSGHVLAVGSVWVLNRCLTLHRWRRVGGLLRVYAAAAFISVFCALFLLSSALVWGICHVIIGSLSAEAQGAGVAAASSEMLTTAFRWFASLGMAGIALMFVYGYTIGQRQLEVTRLRVPLSRGGRGRKPLRVVQISDLHIGTNLTLRQLQHFVGRVNALEPDLICITGDIADSPRADLGPSFRMLGQLQARFGVCAILGNHDHYAGAGRVARELERLTAFRLLRDEAVTLDLDGAPLHVVGLDDRGRDWARGLLSDPRLTELLAAAPRDTPVLLLSHRPDIFVQAAAAGVALTLSGHTHGGQLALPWFGGRRRNLAEFVTAFDRGHYQRGAAHLYVNSGLGVTGQRIRLFTPREITLIEG